MKNANIGPGPSNSSTRMGNVIDINPPVKKFAVVGTEINFGSTISATYKNTIGPKDTPNPDMNSPIPTRTRVLAVSPFSMLKPTVIRIKEMKIINVPTCKIIFLPTFFSNGIETIAKIR